MKTKHLDPLHERTDGVKHGGRAVVSRSRAGGRRTSQGPVGVHQSCGHLGATEVEPDDERGLAG